MKKKAAQEEQELEILKAVAQAWHGHSGNTRPINEFEAHRRNYKKKPTRFKLEALSKPKPPPSKEVLASRAKWDFGQSLWDSYELVTMSKRLEDGLVLDHPMPGTEDSSRVIRKRRESKNSLRNLFYRLSSKRFDAINVAREDNNNGF